MMVDGETAGRARGGAGDGRDVQAGYVRLPGYAAITGLAVNAIVTSTKKWPDRSGRDDYSARFRGSQEAVGEGDEDGGGELGEDEDGGGLGGDAGEGVGEDAANGDGGVGDAGG